MLRKEASFSPRGQRCYVITQKAAPGFEMHVITADEHLGPPTFTRLSGHNNGHNKTARKSIYPNKPMFGLACKSSLLHSLYISAQRNLASATCGHISQKMRNTRKKLKRLNYFRHVQFVAHYWYSPKTQQQQQQTACDGAKPTQGSKNGITANGELF